MARKRKRQVDKSYISDTLKLYALVFIPLIIVVCSLIYNMFIESPKIEQTQTDYVPYSNNAPLTNINGQSITLNGTYTTDENGNLVQVTEAST